MYPYQAYRRRFWLFGLGLILLIALAALMVQFLWNAVLPVVSGAGMLSYLQALGLLILARILVGGWNRPKGHYDKPWGNPRWMQMTDEEKARFSAHWKQRCGYRGADDQAGSPAEVQ